VRAGDPTELVETADRIVAAYTSIGRWVARDFKRSNAPAGLTATQFAILALVDRYERMNTSQLADRLDLTVPTVVRAADALERKSLVFRVRDGDDRREVTLVLTAEGQRMRVALEQARRDRVLRLLSAMREGDVQALLIGFEGLAQAVDGVTDAERTAV
jgi:DNA-binding MarR family transcriptional regulator